MARQSRSSAKNHPVTRVKSRRVEKAAKALMEDFHVGDITNSKLPGASGPDLFHSPGSTPTQEAAARNAFRNLSDGIINAMGIREGKVNANFGDGLVNPQTGGRIFPARRK